MQIEKRTLNWLPKPSTYNLVAAQAAKRKDAAQSFLDSQSSLASNLIGTTTANSDGLVELAQKAAIARITGKTA